MLNLNRRLGRATLSVRPRFTPSLCRLEDRVTPATLYVDDLYRITTNVGPGSLSPGDTVTWDYGQADQVAGLTYGANAFIKVRDAVAAAASGDTILVAAGSYTEFGPTVIPAGESISIIGAGVSRTRLYAGFNTAFQGNDIARAWFQVLDGATLNMAQLTMNGYYHYVSEGIRYATGAAGGTIQNIAFQYIRQPFYTLDGIGIEVQSGNVDVLNCSFVGMGRLGAQYLNAGTTGQFSGNSYTGKGYGNWLDYGIEVGDGANVLISGNNIQFCRGLTFDGFESAGILVDTLEAPGTVATILSNRIINNLDGVFIGIHEGDHDSSTVTANYNNIASNHFGMVVTSSSATVDATHNWWGSQLGPHSHSNPAGRGNPVSDHVDFAPVLTRVAAVLPVTTVAEYLSFTSGFIAVGGGDTGSPTIKVLNPDGSIRYTVDPFPDSNGKYLNFPLTIALGDVTGDGIPDIVAAQGQGGLAQVRVIDGVTHAIVRRYTAPYSASGASVAIGDINGDGVGDVIIGSGPNVTPWVAIYSGKTGGLLRAFQAVRSWLVRGGVNVAAADFNHDGFDDIVIAQGEGNYPDVRVVSGTSASTELRFFRAYDNSFLGGVHVATGDFNGDGIPDILTAGGEGPVQPIKAISGKDLSLLFTLDPVADLGYPSDFLGGVRIAVADLNGDGVPDIVTGPGPGFQPLVKIIDGSNLSELNAFLAFDAAAVGGISVGAV